MTTTTTTDPTSADWVTTYRKTHPEWRTGIDPLACPWQGCAHRAGSIPERNRHVLGECSQRPAADAERGVPRCPECGVACDGARGLASHRRQVHRQDPKSTPPKSARSPTSGGPDSF